MESKAGFSKDMEPQETQTSDSLSTYFPSATPLDKIWAIYRHAAVLDEKKFADFLSKFGFDVDLEDETGATAFHLAAREDSPEAVKTLLACGADIDKKITQRRMELTALTIAASRSNISCMKELIHSGANVDAVNKFGHSALVFATRYGQIDAVRFLIQEGASVNQTDAKGATLLARVLADYKQLVYYGKYHIRINDFWEPDLRKVTPVELLREQADIIECLIQSGAGVNLQDRSDKNALVNLLKEPGVTILEGRIYSSQLPNLCNVLIRHKVNVDFQDEDGRTALIHAVKNPYINNCFDVLLEQNAGVNIPDKEGLTALMYGMRTYGFHPLLFVRHGCDLNLQDNNGRTALMHAIMFSQAEDIRRLLRYHPDTNIQDGDGRTALMYAFLHGSPVWRDLIREDGCDLTIQDNEGRSAATYTTDHECLNMLQSAGVETVLDDNKQCLRLGLFLKDIIYYYRVHDGMSMHTISQRANQLLENCDTPLLEPRHRLLLHELIALRPLDDEYADIFEMKYLIDSNLKQLIRLFVYNGVVEKPRQRYFPNCAYDLSPLLIALQKESSDIAKYVLATCYLQSYDMWAMRHVQTHAAWQFLNRDARAFVQRATSQPWPLVKLAFIAVNTMLGAGPDRERRILQTQLPAKLQRCLMFQEPVAMLPVNEWSKIELCFDYEEYEKLPTPRPLLYHWPFGRKF